MAADRVTDAMVEAAARVVCEVTGETWEHIGSFAQDVLKDTQRAALTAALRAEAGAVGWQDISTAPNDGSQHLRGLWVTIKYNGRPDEKEWRQYVGYVDDESGRFVDPEYAEDFGWQADDYDMWSHLPPRPSQKE